MTADPQAGPFQVSVIGLNKLHELVSFTPICAPRWRLIRAGMMAEGILRGTLKLGFANSWACKPTLERRQARQECDSQDE